MRLIDQRITEISSPALELLIRSLEHTARVPRRPNSTLYHYLLQCLASWDGSKRLKLDKNRVIPGGLLDRKLGKLRNEEPVVYRVCEEVAGISGLTAEVGDRMALYVFLNKFLPDLLSKPKKNRVYDPRDRM